MKRQGLEFATEADVDIDFFGRWVVNGFTGATVEAEAFGDAGDDAGREAAACFGVDGGAAAIDGGEVGGGAVCWTNGTALTVTGPVVAASGGGA